MASLYLDCVWTLTSGSQFLQFLLDFFQKAGCDFSHGAKRQWRVQLYVRQSTVPVFKRWEALRWKKGGNMISKPRQGFQENHPMLSLRHPPTCRQRTWSSSKVKLWSSEMVFSSLLTSSCNLSVMFLASFSTSRLLTFSGWRALSWAFSTMATTDLNTASTSRHSPSICSWEWRTRQSNQVLSAGCALKWFLWLRQSGDSRDVTLSHKSKLLSQQSSIECFASAF